MLVAPVFHIHFISSHAQPLERTEDINQKLPSLATNIWFVPISKAIELISSVLDTKNQSLSPQIYMISLKGPPFPQQFSQCFQFGTLLILVRSEMGVRYADLFQCQPLREPSVHKLYLAFLAYMPPTLRKIDEKEPTSMGTYYIPGFEVFMHYSNTVEVLY
jgi:hypothetical protein